MNRKGWWAAHRIAIALLVGLVAWWIGFGAWHRWITATPLQAPIALAAGAVVEREVAIRVPEHYRLQLVFESDRLPRDGLRALLENRTCPGCGGVPLRWSFVDERGRVAAAGSTDTMGVTAWSASAFYRDVAPVRLAVGRYRFRAEVPREVPGLREVRASVALHGIPKASSTWQITLAWWGSLLTPLLVVPLLGLLAVYLLWSRWRWSRRGKSAG